MKLNSFVCGDADVELMKSLYQDCVDSGKEPSEELVKALDKTKLVQVQRQVQGKTGVFNRMQWVNPNDVKSTDKVVGGNVGAINDKSKAHADEKHNSRQAMVELLKTHGRDGALKMAESQGVTWKKDAHAGINWMRASMAIQNAMKSGQFKVDGADSSKDNSSSKPSNKPTKARKVTNVDDLANGIKSINRAHGEFSNITDYSHVDDDLSDKITKESHKVTIQTRKILKKLFGWKVGETVETTDFLNQMGKFFENAPNNTELELNNWSEKSSNAVGDFEYQNIFYQKDNDGNLTRVQENMKYIASEDKRHLVSSKSTTISSFEDLNDTIKKDREKHKMSDGMLSVRGDLGLESEFRTEYERGISNKDDVSSRWQRKGYRCRLMTTPHAHTTEPIGQYY